jgi:gas vesicle protein
MSDRQVRPTDDGWSVVKPDGARAGAHTATLAEAVTRAVEIVAHDGGGTVTVHGSDEAVRATRGVERATEDTARIATQLTAAAAAAGLGDTAAAAAGEAADVAGDIGDEVTTTAKKVRGHVRHGAQEVAESADDAAEQVEDTAREVASEVRASARRTADELGERAEDAAEELTNATDRAARQGRRAETELRGVADRAGRTIHAYTEAAAGPIDRVAVALNPVRLTGRVVGLLTTRSLRLVGTAASRAGSGADRGARRLEDSLSS